MKDTEKTNLQKALGNLIDEIKELAEQYSESDLDQLLADQIGPALTEDDQIYGTSAFVFLKVAAHLYQPVSDQKSLSVQSALDYVKDKYLLEYVNCVSDVKDFILDHEIATNADKHLRHKWKQALLSALSLEDYAIGELYNRVQGYNNDIERLKEKS